ncbi:hypothetical protein AB4Y89_19790 [Terriglobus sp. 2YAB30_2]|uniref:hypothetical protein n=1 Tax=unclassified Terriglobus TaxID=2628988 RepID=UPI003F97A2B3
MLPSTPESQTLVPFSSEDKEKIRAQMERLLHSTHFRNSKRYPTLLRYMVEETLEGRGAHLKERTLGVEVFGRPADYDTASDPVVRVTVAEIRKRIAQYYHESSHSSELRIELNIGSYVPEFFPARDAKPIPIHDRSPAEAPTPANDVADESAPVSPPVKKSRFSRRLIWTVIPVLLLVIGIASGFLWRSYTPTPMDRLWSPFLAAPGPITFCLPISAKKRWPGNAATTPEAIAHALDLEDTKLLSSGTFFDHETLGENVVYSDVLAMMRLESVVGHQNRPVRVRLNLGTNLNELREGPTVFLGGLDNQWTLKLIEPLRYQFGGSDVDSFYIRDSKDPGNRQWSLHLQDKMTTVNRDYAIIARIHSQVLGQVIVIVAGIGMSGTAAAGEFLSNPNQVAELERRIGTGNSDRDFEAVLTTDVDNGIAGPARIVAVDVR